MPEPKRFRKKAIEVEAVQWTGENREEVEEFVGDRRVFVGDRVRLCTGLAMHAQDALPGDWVVREGVTFVPCKPDVFEATYEPAPAPLQKDGGEGLEADLRERAKAAAAKASDHEKAGLRGAQACADGEAHAYAKAADLAASTQPASPSEEGPEAAGERVEIGSVWRHKSKMHSHVRYRVIEADVEHERVRLERVDGPKPRRQWESQAWLLNKLEQEPASPSPVEEESLVRAIAEVRSEALREPRTVWWASLWDRLFHGERFDDALSEVEADIDAALADLDAPATSDQEAGEVEG